MEKVIYPDFLSLLFESWGVLVRCLCVYGGGVKKSMRYIKARVREAGLG